MENNEIKWINAGVPESSRVPVGTLRGATGAMDQCDKRAIGSLPHSTCI
jgi:hypothetical protein